MASQYDERTGQLKVIDGSAPMARVQSGLSGGTGLTDPLTWANTFKNSQTGMTTSPSAAYALRNTDPRAFTDQQKGLVASLTGNSPATSQPSIMHSILSEILPLNPFANTFASNLSLQAGQNSPGLQFDSSLNVQKPSLTQLANGGNNHIQNWMEKANQGMQAVRQYADPNAPMKPTYGQPVTKDPNSWASAFN